MGNLNLPTGTRTRLFDAVVSVLQNDPVLSSVVANWFVWSGEPTDSEELPILDGKINIRLTPRINALSWWTSESMQHTFSIDIETTIQGTDIRDVLNLQEIIENALYPPSHIDQIAVQEKLRLVSYDSKYGSGAKTGQAMFVVPINESGLPHTVDNNWYAVGSIQFDVRRSLNL